MVRHVPDVARQTRVSVALKPTSSRAKNSLATASASGNFCHKKKKNKMDGSTALHEEMPALRTSPGALNVISRIGLILLFAQKENKRLVFLGDELCNTDQKGS